MKGIRKNQKYTNLDKEVKFLLGGIGTGNVSIDSKGRLIDFEIFNTPSKGRNLPYTFPSIHIEDNNKIINKVLEARLSEPFTVPTGLPSQDLAGLPRFEKSIMEVAYPFVEIKLIDKEVPLDVKVKAFNPFIPLDEDNSSIPGFYLDYEIKNKQDHDITVSVCLSLTNPVGFDFYDPFFHNMILKKPVDNKYYENKKAKGIYYYSDLLDKYDLTYGNMSISTPEKNITYKDKWLIGPWYDGAQDFWNQFSKSGDIFNVQVNKDSDSFFNGDTNLRTGSISIKKTLKPNEKAIFPFVLSWYFPNRINRWGGHLMPYNKDKDPICHNYYSYKYKDSIDVSNYLIKNKKKLLKNSYNFTKAFYNQTIPYEIIEAITANITTLRSSTCFRVFKEGTFCGFEGSFINNGSCEGNCSHVWNYEEMLAYLFPNLEHNMQETFFNNEVREDGSMSFRANSIFNDPNWEMLPATDGQLGLTSKLYRDWLISGDDEMVKRLYPKVKKSMHFASKYWDLDGDGLLESRQHNTYDIEFYGPNSLTNTIYFTAIKAYLEMAKLVDDKEEIRLWTDILNKGSKKMDELLWNGSYYIQKIDDVNKYKYQYGKGCLADQIFGELLAKVRGLDYTLPKEHIHKAIKEVYDNNYRFHLSKNESVQRVYGLNDEGGLLLCSWPNGGRPRIPFVYSDEVWSGIEYQVASNLILEGYLKEGLNVIKTVRNRYNGRNRNPFCEIECGNHYVRSMASFTCYLAYTGFHVDLRKNIVRFNPVVKNDEYHYFIITKNGFGLCHKEKGKELFVETLFGNLQDLKIIGE